MKKTFKIAHLEVEAPVFLAPLAGISDAPFRLICREQGAAWVCSELVSSDGLIRGSQRTLEYLYFYPAERPVGVQLFGSDPGVMAEAARYVSSRPPELRPDFIDLNIGCPVHKVVTREAGAALLCNLPLLETMVRAVVAASTLPVTAKTRCGWDNDHKNGVEVAQRLEQCGVAMVAIHARTRAQKFEGEADWSVIREAKQKVSIPLVGNGDVVSAAAAKAMLEETGCDAVMVGRGAFGNPWIFREARALLERGEIVPPATPRERLGALLRQYRMACTITNERHATNEIKKHVAWYVKGLPNAVPFKERGQRIAVPADLEVLVADYLAELTTRGVADLPGGIAPRGHEPAVAVGDAGDDDASLADDGSAEAASLAAQES
ncbi:MAG: tRNA dihydrouridine synthase DusB [Candidatus Eisenbacteria bacterium]